VEVLLASLRVHLHLLLQRCPRIEVCVLSSYSAITTYVSSLTASSGSSGGTQSLLSLSDGTLPQFDNGDSDISLLYSDSESEGWSDSSEGDHDELPRLLVRLHISKKLHSYLSKSFRDITPRRASANTFLPFVKMQVLH
jgi:hypothetical protein